MLIIFTEAKECCVSNIKSSPSKIFVLKLLSMFEDIDLLEREIIPKKSFIGLVLIDYFIIRKVFHTIPLKFHL